MEMEVRAELNEIKRELAKLKKHAATHKHLIGAYTLTSAPTELTPEQKAKAREDRAAWKAEARRMEKYFEESDRLIEAIQSRLFDTIIGTGSEA